MVNFQSRNSRQGGRGSSSRPSPPPKVLTKKEIQQKQQKLTNSLREAETKQLAEYLKNRSSLLDEEIQQTREKLNLNLSSSSSQEPKLSIHPRERERGLRSSKEKSRDDDFTTIENYQKEEYQLKYLLQRLLQCKMITLSLKKITVQLYRYGRFSDDSITDYIMFFTITTFEI